MHKSYRSLKQHSLCLSEGILRYSGMGLGGPELVKQHQMVKSMEVLILFTYCNRGCQILKINAVMLVIFEGQWQF